MPAVNGNVAAGRVTSRAPASAPSEGPAKGADSTRQNARERRIEVDGTLSDGPAGKARTQGWILYAFSHDLFDSQPGKPAGFWREAAGRRSLAESWQKERPGVGHDPYLDKLVEVAEAGFIEEYSLAYLARPGWWISPQVLARLRWDAFIAWRSVHLVDHKVETRARVVRWGKSADPPAPGADLPSLAELDLQTSPCSKLAPFAAARLTRWEEATRSGPRIISLETLAQVPLAFDLAAKSERAQREGVILATPSVVQLAWIAGYCDIEAERGAEAQRELERGLGISPGHPRIESELIHSLIMQKKLGEAEAETEQALTWSLDGCAKALFLRRKGYLLFERGRLADAYVAYRQSLAHDPASVVAHQEMETIVLTLKKAGTYDEKALAAAVPRTVSVRATACH